MDRRSLGGAGEASAQGVSGRRQYTPGGHSRRRSPIMPRRPGIGHRPGGRSSWRIRPRRSRRRFSSAASASRQPLRKRSSRGRARPGKATGDCFGRSRWWRSSPVRRLGAQRGRIRLGQAALGRQTLPFPTTCKRRSRSSGKARRRYRAVLACAACGCDGREFRVSVLADALNRTCLDLLIVLDEIERTTGMVHDVRDRDDVYAFHSSFLLEVIRGRLGIAGHGRAQRRRPPDRSRVPRPAGRRPGSRA